MSTSETEDLQVEAFRGGTLEIVDAWNAAMPHDPITTTRLRNLVLLDANFDARGLLLVRDGARVLGAAYAVRRRHAMVGDDLEPGEGWVPFFFVRPDARRRGVAAALFRGVQVYLMAHGVRWVHFSPYTPNYVLPGLDVDRYPEAAAFLRARGFEESYEAVAMCRSLADHGVPDRVRQRLGALRAEGHRIGPCTVDDLPVLVALAGDSFNPDWARVIRESVTGGLDLENIVIARAPSGDLIGWAMHGAYEGVQDRFGPFGVHPDARGLGLGKVLLHETLAHMRAVNSLSAWFLWTELDSPAGHLYTAAGFTVMRRFSILRASINSIASAP